MLTITDGIRLLAGVRSREAMHLMSRLAGGSRLRAGVTVTAFALLWAGAYALFDRMLRFCYRFQGIGPLLVDRMLALFFAAMFGMLCASGFVVALTTLYQSREVETLFVGPLRRESVLAVKGVETIALAAWAPLFLMTALLAAYGRVTGRAAEILLVGAAGMPPFLVLSAGLGMLGLILLLRIVPMSRVYYLAPLGFTVVSVGLVALARLPRLEEIPAPQATLVVNELLRHTRFSEWPWWPSTWMTTLVLGAGRDGWQPARAAWPLWLLTVNVLMLGWLVVVVGRWYYLTWAQTKSAAMGRRRAERPALVWRAVAWAVRWWRLPVQQLVLKDLKLFCRDPGQWSQALVFFGLIGVYILNLRTLPYNLHDPFWKNLIGFLNLSATALTMAMLNVRFIFPLISQEGRRYWLLGLGVLTPGELLWQKFWVSVVGSLGITEALVIASNLMLRVSPLAMALSCGSILVMCVAVAGLSVGLGAIYLDPREENPARILSGFGGTLLLVLSLCYVGAVVCLEAIPLHWFVSGQIRSIEALRLVTLVVGTVIIGVSALCALVPMRLGIVALTRREF